MGDAREHYAPYEACEGALTTHKCGHHFDPFDNTLINGMT
jgi:hypothetical protein